MWMITGYAEVRQFLRSPYAGNCFERGAATQGRPGFPLSLDPPDHTRIRRMLNIRAALRFRSDGAVNGVRALPVAWG